MKESLEEYRNNITLHLARISGDLEHIKEKINGVDEKVNNSNKHLEKINGRLRVAENSITGMKAVGFTLYAIIGVVLTWLGVRE